MKKKSIFVVALAALMLIAFTACEQPANIWNPNGKIPTALNITQNEPFVEGQLFDASKFSVEVVYQDGSKETTTSANVTLHGGTDSVLAPGAVVSASLTTVGANAGSFQVSSTRAIDVRTIDSVTVVAPATLDLNSSVDSIAVKSLFTVTANYEGGSVVVKPAEFAISGLNTTTKGEDKTGAIDVKFASDTVVATSDAFTIDIVDPEEEPVPPAEWDGKTLIVEVQDEVANGSFIYVQRAEVSTDMVRVWQSVDNEKGEEITDFTVAPKTPLTGEGNENRFAAATTGVLVVTYEYADEVTGEIKEAKAETSPINLRADYATSISAEWKHADDPEANAVTSGGAISKADITVTPVWKSGYVPTTNNVVATGDFTVDPAKAADDYTSAAWQTVTIKYTPASLPTYTDSAADTTVDIWVAAATQPGA